MYCSIGGSYFSLGPLLPALHAKLLDRELLQDRRLLVRRHASGLLEHFVNSTSVEWFAFFYYSYYALLGLFTSVRYSSIAASAATSCCSRPRWCSRSGTSVTRSCLVPVPTPNPDLHFERALVGGMWWQRVEHAVKIAGAQYDIFPSLHTAVSVLMGLHAHRYRHTTPFRCCYRFTWVWVASIVVSTVFLRWHYGIDLVAGALLAWSAQRIARAFWHVEGARDGESHQLVWEPILPPSTSLLDAKWLSGIIGLQLFACILLAASS